MTDAISGPPVGIPGGIPGDTGSPVGAGEAPPSGLEPADAVDLSWRRAVAAARLRGHRPGDRPADRFGARGRSAPRADSPAAGAVGGESGPSPRDPQPVGALAAGLVAQAGWTRRIEVAAVLARWAEVVGPDVAARCTPERFDDGVLVIRAGTTAWATQLGYLTEDLARRVAAEVGEGVVARIEVRGPSAPSWRRGRLAVPGARGPRDTYG